jgi:hypothetical protein
MSVKCGLKRNLGDEIASTYMKTKHDATKAGMILKIIVKTIFALHSVAPVG